MDYEWVKTLTISESEIKKKNGETKSLFYIKEQPFIQGRSYQSTTLTKDAALYVIAQLKKELLMQGSSV